MWSKRTCYGCTLLLCSKNELLVFLKKRVDRLDLILMFYFDSNTVTFLYVRWQYQTEQLPMDLWEFLFHNNHIDFYLVILAILKKSLRGGCYSIFQQMDLELLIHLYHCVNRPFLFFSAHLFFKQLSQVSGNL